MKFIVSCSSRILSSWNCRTSCNRHGRVCLCRTWWWISSKRSCRFSCTIPDRKHVKSNKESSSQTHFISLTSSMGTPNSIRVLCSKIRKKNELNIILQENQGRPHLICLGEHHMGKEEMKGFTFLGYKLANCFCHETYSKGGVCILARNDMIHQAINLNKVCKKRCLK